MRMEALPTSAVALITAHPDYGPVVCTISPWTDAIAAGIGQFLRKENKLD